MRGRAVIRISTKGGEERRGKAAIFVKRPDKVRIEIFGPFGSVAAVLVSDAQAFSILSDKERELFPHNEASPLNFPPDELAGFIMGTGFGDYTIERDKSGNIKEITEDSRAADGQRVVMGDFRRIGEIYFPFSISVENKRGRLYIRYSSVELNHELNDALFIHPQPGSLKGGKSLSR